MLLLDQKSSESLRRLGNHADWSQFLALIEKTYEREVESLLATTDTNRLLRQQGYVSALKDLSQAARSAIPSLPYLGQ